MIYEKSKTRNISFPLGGIGTGCIGLLGNGELGEWEIYNRPNKRCHNGFSHFAIKVTSGNKSVVKVLHGDTNDNLSGSYDPCDGNRGFGYGVGEASLSALPHFKDLVFDGAFPIARLTFSESDFPVVARLCAFNPFIPHDEFNSSIPAAFFEWELENTTNDKLSIALAATVRNPPKAISNKNISDGGLSGILYDAEIGESGEARHTDICLLTDHGDAAVQEYWYRGKWKDALTTYWRELSCLDRMSSRVYSESANEDCGTVVSYADIAPGERVKIRYVIAWNSPEAYNYWKPRDDVSEKTWKNYYATQFENSLASAKYAIENFSSLYEKTAEFSDALQSSTLPDSVKDAVCSNLSVLKTPTALRLEDGTFWGWEGCGGNRGSCFGSCQHVWNYAYAMPYLFPRLERSMRELTFKYALMDSGATSFRINLPPRSEMVTGRACLDGQMGEVIKCYREWKLSGDDAWLRRNAESIFKMLEYAWSEENPDKWDYDMDGVLEGRQHHTLDMELFGPSSWLEGFYLLALDCASQMADALGERERAEKYLSIYNSGKAWMNENLFNGRYFCQKVDISDKSLVDRFNAADSYWNSETCEIKYQVADGCIIDQMLADWHATLIGVNGVFDSDKKAVALKNLYKNNYKKSMRDVANMWRSFAVNDEQGTIMCTYPDGAVIPSIPIPYCEETMTGFEYALAGLMIAEGYVFEGESIVKAIRDRYDGEKRNPWNEIECGSNYARSMASYALMAIYSGFTFDMTKKRIGFSPIGEVGKYVFSVAESWGTAEFGKGECTVKVLGNPLTLSSISILHSENITSVSVDGRAIDFNCVDGIITFDATEIKEELRLS